MGTSRIQTKEDLIEALRLCARGRKCRECPLGDVFACKAALMLMAADRLDEKRGLDG